MDPVNNPAPELDPATPAPEGPQEGTNNALADAGNTPDPKPTADPAPAEPKTPEGLAEDAPGDWPENWRELYANGDEKLAKQLSRYASPKAALDALFEAQKKIRSGELKSALKPNATPEEIASWRADNGIPEAPDKYELNLPNGLVIGEADKPVVDEFLKKAHEANLHPDQVNGVLGWYYEQQEQQLQRVQEYDTQTYKSCEDELRAEFGTEYRRNMAVANELLSGAPEGVKDTFLAARGPDGKPVGNDPNVIRWLVNLSREINPVGTVVPGSGTNAMQAAESELSSLRKMMGDHSSEYWKGPNSERNQKRYLELTSAMERAQGRAA